MTRWIGLGLVVSLLGCPSDDDGESDAAFDAAIDAGRLADGAPIDIGRRTDGGSDVVSCAIVQERRRMCTRGGDATLIDLASCDPGDRCDLPSPYNEELPDIMCVDEYRFTRFEYPAACAQVEEFFAGSRECLVPSHCAGRPMSGDWICDLGSGCVCPPGGDCPVPLPPGRDAGTSDAATRDAGMDAGSGDGGTDVGVDPTPDAGMPDAGGPPMPDAGPPPPPP